MTPAEALDELRRIGMDRAYRHDDTPLTITRGQARELRKHDELNRLDAIARGCVPLAASEAIPLGLAVQFVVRQADSTLPEWIPDSEGTRHR